MDIDVSLAFSNRYTECPPAALTGTALAEKPVEYC
jgi:hypothetical protein